MSNIVSNNGTKDKGETNRRINSARDILVGKIPDPKAQVEQITTALIYKFMDDMDRSSEEVGGNASFIVGELEPYRWSRLMSKEIGGTERLHLYSEALIKFSQSKQIPEIFRKIFKDAFLPYRDPEILNLFLKEIDWFDYDHSENLGDAFEYLLNIMGSQGDAGQFRTPRHIIDFIVDVVKPRKTDKILDPACGTAGFLISAYKFIKKNQMLAAEDKLQLAKNFVGYDISPDMVRLSLVNLYLHDFKEPEIHEYDTLTSEKFWNERFDVILANPPFMTPKGGIRPHEKFAVQAKRSEVLFVDYIAEHLTLNGRGGVIVPEGIIFQSAKAYQALRKMLIEDNFLWAVVSLPSGIFQPYSGVKTSVLLFDRTFAKQQDSILFVKIENDGLSFSAQRRESAKNDLPQALKLLAAFQRGETVDDPLALVVTKAKIAESGDFNLTGERYRESKVHCSSFPMVRLGDICEIFIDGDWIETKDQSENGIRLIQTGNIGEGCFLDKGEKARFISEETFNKLNCKEVFENDLLVSRLPEPVGRTCLVPKMNQKLITAVDCTIVRAKPQIVLQKYLLYVMNSEKYFEKIFTFLTGASRQRISRKNLESIEIPLPPLEIQNAIVAEIEQWQKVIDGAKQVVAHYRPTFSINPEWEVVKLGDVITLQRGYDLPKQEWRSGKYPIIGSNGIIGYHDCYKEVGPGVVTGRSGTIGKVHFVETDYYWPHNTSLFVKDFKGNEPKFVQFLLESVDLKSLGESTSAVPSLDRKNAHRINVSLPPLSEQKAIVAELEKERAAVDACKQLIAQFEAKIKAKIATVWESDKKTY